MQLNPINHSCVDHGKKGNGRGYAVAWYQGVSMNMHRALYLKAYGYIPEGHVIMHLCDNPRCINLHHLVANTSSANRLDCVRKQRHFSRKALDDEQVAVVLEQIRAGSSQKQVAAWHNVNQSTISRIVKHAENTGGTGIIMC